MKTLLVLGAGQDQLFMIRTARAMGVRTLAIDQNPRAPGFAEADEHAVVSTRDIARILSFVNDYQGVSGGIDGVSTMGSDIPDIVAAVAQHLGTPSISTRSARLATEKFEMKERFREAGVKTPWYRLVTSGSDVRSAFDELGTPVVIKPVDQAGSRGVSLLRDAGEADRLFMQALEQSRSGRVLLEAFVAGPQISTESILFDGKIYTPGYADRNYERLEDFLPQIMENGGWVPSLYEDRRADVEAEIARAASALGIERGVLKGDVVLGPDGPVIIEVAARLSGGDFSESLVPLGTGINYVEAVIQLALGERPDPRALEPSFSLAVANRYFFAEPGTLRAVHGVEDARAHEWIRKCEIWYQPGDQLPQISGHGQRTGVFVVVAPDRETAQERIDLVYEQVYFEVE